MHTSIYRHLQDRRKRETLSRGADHLYFLVLFPRDAWFVLGPTNPLPTDPIMVPFIRPYDVKKNTHWGYTRRERTRIV
jgi:hypothetical protein